MTKVATDLPKHEMSRKLLKISKIRTSNSFFGNYAGRTALNQTKQRIAHKKIIAKAA
jgi:hypothetical protein